MNYSLSRDINKLGVIDFKYMFELMTEHEEERQKKREEAERAAKLKSK
jgi:hypothetical protein